MKEIIGKKKCNNETLPKHLIVDKIEIHDAKSIAEKFNEKFNGLDVNIVTSVYEFIKKQLLKIFNESINLGISQKK